MRRLDSAYRFIFYLLLVTLISGGCHSSGKKFLADLVDPEIGGVGLLLQPTRPTVQLPNQVVRVYPVREDYLADRIDYFPLTIISHRNGELFGIMPFTGQIHDPVQSSSWDENLEVSKPYYFSTWLEDWKVMVEFAPGEKAGIFRFSFPPGTNRGISLCNLRKGKWRSTGSKLFSAEDSFSGMKAFAVCSLNCNVALTDTTVSGKIVSFLRITDTARIVEMKYAVSFISAGQAEKNLHGELDGRTFADTRDKARDEWEKVLCSIQVKGGSDKDKRVFYTALYRCFERMVNITEDGKYYSNYDSTVHKSDRNFYVDDWTWDTYLALHPLRTIIAPDIESDMMQSYVEMYRQCGWMPTFPVLFGDVPCMNGFHSTIMIVDEYMKGIRNFDFKTAYEGMKKNSLSATMLPWRNGPSCSLDDFYRQKGYYPALHPGEKETVAQVHPWERRQAVAVTLGHSYDDWALAQMARELGKEDDYKLFLGRSQNYRNLWWDEKGFFMPKDKEGRWIGIDPKWDGGMGGRDYYDENNGWTYLWQVQHDIPGLISLMGGKDKFEKRLDQLFTEDLGRSKYENWAKFPDFSGIVGEYSMGNEPSFHIPYLYNFTGSPWKTQKRIRMLLNAWFRDDIFGIPGDEDGGGMSAFVVFSMIGIYPVTPGVPEYTLGSPFFRKVTINLKSGKTFIIESDNYDEKNFFIRKAFLNGKALEKPFISHEMIESGGVLKLVMGKFPSGLWSRSENP